MYKMSEDELTKRLNDFTYKLFYDEENKSGFETWYYNGLKRMKIIRNLSKEDVEALRCKNQWAGQKTKKLTKRATLC